MNLSRSLEDYLESIYLIMLENDVVRIKKIASEMNVSAPSALGAVRNLEKEDLVIHEKYGSVKLTEKGEVIARNIFQKHRTLFIFLNEILGLDTKTAKEEACNLEHYLSDETSDRFIKFINYLKSCPTCQEKGFNRFHEYYNNKKTDKKINPINLKAPITELKTGTTGNIYKIEGDNELRRKLINQGILPKLNITIGKIFSDEIELIFDDYTINLIKELCHNIIIEVSE